MNWSLERIREQRTMNEQHHSLRKIGIVQNGCLDHIITFYRYAVNRQGEEQKLLVSVRKDDNIILNGSIWLWWGDRNEFRPCIRLRRYHRLGIRVNEILMGEKRKPFLFPLNWSGESANLRFFYVPPTNRMYWPFSSYFLFSTNILEMYKINSYYFKKQRGIFAEFFIYSLLQGRIRRETAWLKSTTERNLRNFWQNLPPIPNRKLNFQVEKFWFKNL